ncbi:MAG: type II secretion system protein [Candidatus Humimicrobiaceae bacterium]
MIKILNNFIRKVSNKLKVKDGMTLVEVVIAFLVIAIVSTVLVRGTITGVNTLRINKSKTEALAIANEKIEILKAIDYSEIEITEDEKYDDGGWISGYPELDEGEFDVIYDVSWVQGNVDSYKQLKVTVFGGYMSVPVGVVTQMYPPVGEEATGGNIYPPPDDLIILSDEGDGESREIILNWVAPDTDKNIIKYNIYKDGELLDSSVILYYSDYPGDDNTYTYHVKTVYEGVIESVKSNSVTTGTPFVYPPPENFVVTGYSGGMGEDRTVHLAWSAPVTELIIIEYQIYRDGEYIGSTTDLTYENVIGSNNYTFYVKILYENDILSEPSNSVAATG